MMTLKVFIGHYLVEKIKILFLVAETEVNNIEEFFSSGQNGQENEILEKIKGSFSIWRKCTESPLEYPFLGTDSFKNITRRKKFFKCLKYFLILIGLLISVAVIGIIAIHYSFI